MFESIQAKDNAMLLCRLKEAKGAKAFGSISGFFDTPPTWRCPSCFRSKEETARVDKNGALLCALHWHHDHFVDFFDEDFRSILNVDLTFKSAIEASLTRFPYTLICNDCNVAEPKAKQLAGAPQQFSFTPYEISHFIIIDAERNIVTVDPVRAQEAYEAARPAMRLIATRLKAIRKALNAGTPDFEPVVQPAMRVLSMLRVVGKNDGDQN